MTKIEMLRKISATPGPKQNHIPDKYEAPPIVTRCVLAHDGEAAAEFLDKFGLDGRKIEACENPITIIIVDASLWARSGYLATFILVDADTEREIATFTVK